LRVFPIKYRLTEVRYAPYLSAANLATFCSNNGQQPLGAATSVKLTWLERSPTLLSIGPPASPKPNLWNLTERLFSTHSWRRPLSMATFSSVVKGIFTHQTTAPMFNVHVQCWTPYYAIPNPPNWQPLPVYSAYCWSFNVM
jgi:hypothetical protein